MIVNTKRDEIPNMICEILARVNHRLSPIPSIVLCVFPYAPIEFSVSYSLLVACQGHYGPFSMFLLCLTSLSISPIFLFLYPFTLLLLSLTIYAYSSLRSIVLTSRPAIPLLWHGKTMLQVEQENVSWSVCTEERDMSSLR